MNDTQSRQELIAVYKSQLRSVIERRPSGLRLKIAAALGTHKSFVSQITNPADPTPLPAKHIRSLFEICQFTPAERKSFLAAYEATHQRDARSLSGHSKSRRVKTLEIQIPVLARPAQQKALESLIRGFVQRVTSLLDK